MTLNDVSIFLSLLRENPGETLAGAALIVVLTLGAWYLRPYLTEKAKRAASSRSDKAPEPLSLDSQMNRASSQALSRTTESAGAVRRVTKTRKDRGGDIIKLDGPWGTVSKAQAIRDIESGTNSYYVQQPNCGRSDVHVVKGATGKYLRSDPDSSSDNNLDNLPDC